MTLIPSPPTPPKSDSLKFSPDSSSPPLALTAQEYKETFWQCGAEGNSFAGRLITIGDRNYQFQNQNLHIKYNKPKWVPQVESDQKWQNHLKLKQLLWPVLAALLCLAIAVAGVSAQEPQILQASRDNTPIENSTEDLSNGIGPSFFVGRTNQSSNSIRRGLIAFDIDDAIPAGSTVTEVKLT